MSDGNNKNVESNKVVQESIALLVTGRLVSCYIKGGVLILIWLSLEVFGFRLVDVDRSPNISRGLFMCKSVLSMLRYIPVILASIRDL